VGLPVLPLCCTELIIFSRISLLVSKYESDLAEKLIRKDKDEDKSFGYWSPAVSFSNIQHKLIQHSGVMCISLL
jgi:hypothetical protein